MILEIFFISLVIFGVLTIIRTLIEIHIMKKEDIIFKKSQKEIEEEIKKFLEETI